MKSTGKRSALRFTALFKFPVVTPYSAARSESNNTFSPRMTRIARATRSIGITSLPIADDSTKQPRHLNERRIENVEDELRCDADGEHEQCYGNHHEFLSSQKIWKRAAIFCERSAEESLHGSYKNDGGDEKAYHGNGRERRRHRERRLENQKLANKSIQPR